MTHSSDNAERVRIPRNFDYTAVHVAGAERIANIAARSGVPRLVHLSHLNASSDSTSKFYQTKAEGEERVRAVFPDATIIRPANMYGYEDKLLNNIASQFFKKAEKKKHYVLMPYYNPVWPIWWKLNHGETKIRPVHVSIDFFREADDSKAFIIIGYGRCTSFSESCAVSSTTQHTFLARPVNS